MSESPESVDEAPESEADETPPPLAPAGIWVRTKSGGRRPLIRDWTGDLELDALRMVSDSDLAAIAEDRNNPLHKKAEIVKRQNEDRWQQIGKLISASATPFSDILSAKMFDVSSLLPKIDYSAVLPKIDYSLTLPKIDYSPILFKRDASPYVSRGIEASLRRAERASEAVAGEAAAESAESEGLEEGSAVSLSEAIGPEVNEILANLLDAFHVQRAESTAQHDKSVAHLENQSKALAAMADIARAQAAAAQEDSKRAVADAIWHRKSAKRSQRWTVFAALSAVIIGLLTLLVPFWVTVPTHHVFVPSAPAERDDQSLRSPEIDVPLAPGFDSLERGNWVTPADG